MKNGKIRIPSGMSRRQFLRYYGIASSALTFSPFFLERMTAVCQAAASLTRVYKVKNGDCFQNISKLWQMLDGVSRYISPTDVVVIKANAQWPRQGYTHTGCIKGVIDQILNIPGFSGEILLCDNIQNKTASQDTGFDASLANRANNWPDKNWDELAADYRSSGKPVATVRWANNYTWRNPSALPHFSGWNPGDGPGWGRYFFNYNTRQSYISYPVFQSPLTAGRMIDMRNGVWEGGGYTGRKVKAIFMPTLNNHGYSKEDTAGVTSAIKSFFGATEIHSGDNGVWNGFYQMHSTSFTQACPQCVGELPGIFIRNLYAPVLYITAAMYSGWEGRTQQAAATRTVLACENPVSLDYIACRDVISPYASWLNPNLNNNTRSQIIGCNSQGIGTMAASQIEVISYDFERPTATRLDIERKIRDFKAGSATEQEVKDTIRLYMSND